VLEGNLKNKINKAQQILYHQAAISQLSQNSLIVLGYNKISPGG